MSTIRYFAYGSNLLTARLRRRCPRAELLTTARAHGHTLAFRKRSVDASAKATLIAARGWGISAPGAVFAIDRDELAALDAAEGPGYRRLTEFPVQCLRTDEFIVTQTYMAIEQHRDMRPYDWYLALVLAGVGEHGLGDAYAAQLRAVLPTADEELERPSRKEALRALREGGIYDYRVLLDSAGECLERRGRPADAARAPK